MNHLTNASKSATFVKNANCEYIAVTDGFLEMFSIVNRKSVLKKKSSEVYDKAYLVKLSDSSDQECIEKGSSHYTIANFQTTEDGLPINLIVNKVCITRNKQRLIVGTCLPSQANHVDVYRYKAQLKYFSQLSDGILAFAFLDLTDRKNIVLRLRDGNKIKNLLNNCPIEEFHESMQGIIADDKLRRQYKEEFNCDKLIEYYERGLPSKKMIFPISIPNMSSLIVCQEFLFTINPFNGHLCVFLFGTNVTDEVNEKTLLAQAAEIDAMTGIYNHAAVLKHISDYLEETINVPNLTYAFCIFDINHFKHVNDIFGHKVGDDLLIKVAEELKKISSDHVIYGRLGGDEFVIFVKNIISKDTLISNTQRLLSTLQFRLAEDRRELEVSASIGIYIFDNAEENIDSLYIKSDKALYSAKSKNMPCYCIYNDMEAEPKDIPEENTSLNPVLSSRYADLLSSYENISNDSTSVFHINLTQNRIIEHKLGKHVFAPNTQETTADAFFKCLNASINASASTVKELSRTINRKFYLLAAQRGEYSFYDKFELYMNDDQCYEHHKMTISMAVNPINQDTEALVTFLNDNVRYYTSLVANNIMDINFDYAAIINVKDKHLRHLKVTGKDGIIPNERYPYNDAMSQFIKENMMEEDWRTASIALHLRTVINALRNTDVYSVPINIFSTDVESQHKLLQFSYLDEEHTIIHLLMTDFTAQADLEYNKVSGLLNRRGFFSHTRKLLNEYPDKDFVLVRWDIDSFKLFNGIFGMSVGDEILATIGNAMKQFTKDTTVISNLSGDVFALCMERKNFDPDYMLDFITNLLDSLTEDYYFTFHMAAYAIKDKSEDITIMCDRAQLAEETIKSTHIERFVWYNESMHANYYNEQTLLLQLRKSLTDSPEDFVMYVQPQYNIMNKKICGGEALVRWRNSETGITAPGTFVPLLEKTNLISKLDVLIWEQACKYLDERIKSGKTVVPLSINISRCDFYALDVPKYLNKLTERYEIPHKYLFLEITESAYTTDGNFIIKIIKRLRKDGYVVEMDDFGSGYSSLNTLKTVPLDTIKIDMRFFDIEKENNTTEFVRRGNIVVNNIVRLAKELKLSIIAEGIETREQADFLHKINCPVIQGFLFSAPVPPEEFSDMVDSKKSLSQSGKTSGLRGN